MIYIEKDTSNKIALSLKESSTIDPAFYLFVFEDEFNTDISPIEFYTPNISTRKDRYDLFEIVEGTDITLVKGQYIYKVYEAATPPATIGDTTGDVVEEGRMIVSSDIIEFNTIYD